ncbi:hypothetical protein DMQ64_28155 [Klebsiella pneumoniae]|nr:hypothetical protein DMQ64_28155 [Klebsiella pneumoniae]
MGSCAAPSAKGDDKFITTDYLQQCPVTFLRESSATSCDSRCHCRTAKIARGRPGAQYQL